MATKGDLYRELDYLSEAISTQVWILSLSVIGTTWGLLILPAGSPLQSFAAIDALPIFVSCFIALLFHLLQYVFGYLNAWRIRRYMEKHNLSDFQYDKKAIFYRLRTWSFVVKIVATGIGAGILVVKISVRLFLVL
jgi:hypothetical protein